MNDRAAPTHTREITFLPWNGGCSAGVEQMKAHSTKRNTRMREGVNEDTMSGLEAVLGLKRTRKSNEKKDFDFLNSSLRKETNNIERASNPYT